jgi:S1-C subfamily serine protease
MRFNRRHRGLWTALWFVMIASGLRSQVPASVIRRVLLIRVGDSTGSSFTLDVGGRQYLITAKHVLAGLVGNASIQVYQGGAWQSVAVRVLDSEPAADIAVLAPAARLTLSTPLEPGSGLAFAGQDAYFVGFPYGLRMKVAPIVKTKSGRGEADLLRVPLAEVLIP